MKRYIKSNNVKRKGKLITAINGTLEESNRGRKRLKDKIISTLEFLDTFEDIYKFPETILGDSWDDLKSGILMGIDTAYEEIAQTLVDYLEPFVEFDKRHPEILDEDPIAADALEEYENLKSELKESYTVHANYKKQDMKASTNHDYEELERPAQEYDSAATSINSTKLPAIYKLVNFQPGKLYLDFGGGKFDNGVYFVQDKGATLLVYDPYNRSDEHNKEVLQVIRENGGADATLNSNVLNVIKEPEARLGVLKNIKKLTKPGGDVYITVYEGSGKGNEGPTKAGYQLNRKTAEYLEEIQSIFPDAKRRGKLIHATNTGAVSSSRLIKSNYKIASDANVPIGIEIDAENLRGKSREEIKQILDEAPIGSQVIHIRNLENRFNMDEVIRKKQAYKSNYFNPVGAPGDFNSLDTYWTKDGYEDPYIDKTIYDAVNGTSKYYGLTSEVLKAHGITSSVHLGDEVEWNNQKYIVIDDEEVLRLRPVDRFSDEDFDDMESGDPSEDVYLEEFQIEGTSYGGAYDVLDEYYFTRDDLVDFGEEVVNQLENIEPGNYFVNDLYMTDPKTIHIEIYCRDREAYADKDIVIDMRRIHIPSDLNKYAPKVANEFYREFNEYELV